MNVRALLDAARRWYATHSERDRRILLGVGGAIALSLVYVTVIDPLRTYRKHVGEEIAEGHEQLERSARFLGAADALRAERDDLRKRLDQAKDRLLPGDSGTLGAAALQDRANGIAAEKGITVQSTQVMREEPADPFRKVAVRLTLSGELKPFSEFISGLEYGPQQLNLPFVEVSRRGAVAGAKGPRTLSATVEVSGYLRGGEEAKKDAEGGEAKTPEGEGAEGEAAPPGGEEEKRPAGEGAANPPASNEAAAPPASQPAAPAVPAPTAPPEAS